MDLIKLGVRGVDASMKVKTIEFENFNNYKEPCMFIGTTTCSWKCCIEGNIPVESCQNHEWVKKEDIEIDNDDLAKRYVSNFYSFSIVFGGLEPFDQFDDMLECITVLRRYTSDDIVIYSGYNKDEINDKLEKLKVFKNIIVKFGRFEPSKPMRYDPILGVTLISNNQYAEKIS